MCNVKLSLQFGRNRIGILNDHTHAPVATCPEALCIRTVMERRAEDMMEAPQILAAVSKKAYGVVVSMSVFHCGNQGLNPGRCVEI